MSHSLASARRRFIANVVAQTAGLSAALSSLGWVSGAQALAPNDPLSRPAEATPRVMGAFMLDITRAGERLIAVGERGSVLLSDDAGKSWRQAACPVSVTLTAVEFPSAQLGWAVGHAGVVLHSKDAGATWALQLDGKRAAALELQAAQQAAQQAVPQAGDPSRESGRLRHAQELVDDGADKPLLAVHADPAGRRILAIGAYGTAFASEDGGASWSSWIGRLDNPKSLHLNALRVVGQRLYIAGEQGLLLRSDDAGEHFTRLASPYAGSWFALTGVQDQLLVAAGLRGNVWYSEDHGASFQKSQQPLPISFTSALRDPQATAATATSAAEPPLMLVNQAGMVLASSDRARSWRPLPLPPGPPLTRIAQAGDGALVAATMAGVKRLPPPGQAPGQPGQPAPGAAATAR